MTDKTTEDDTISSVGVEKICSNFGGDRTPMAVTNLELQQKSSIYDFACRSPEYQDSFHLNVVFIPTSLKRTVTKKIDL